jgi:fibronectin-binding autotransporter adhesin
VAGNWTGGVVADGVGALADFSTLNITANATVTLDGARTIGTLKFQDITTASNDWILNPGTGDPLTLDVATGQAQIQVLNRTATVATVLAGNDGISVNNGGGGGGTLILNGANTFTGQLTIGTGMTLQAGNAATLGTAGAGNETIVQPGATLNTNGQNLGLEIVRASGVGVGGIGAVVNNGTPQNNTLATLILTNNTTVGGSGRWDLRNGTPLLDLAGFRLTKIAGNQVSVVGGSITDGMIDVNAGTLSIESNTSVKGNGTITINAAGVLGLWADVAGSQTRPVVLNGGTIRELGNTNVAEGPNLSFPVLLTAPSTLDTGTAANDVQTSFLNDIQESGGSFGITKVGTRTLRFGRGVNISGPLTVNGGPVVLNAGSTLSTRVISLASGASFDTSAVGGYTLGSGGILTVGHTGAAANDVIGPFTAAPGSTINLNTSGTNNTATFANGLTINNTNFNFDIGGAAPDQVAVTGNLNVSGANPITLRAYGTSGITPGNYSLFTYTTGAAPTAANFTLTNASNFRQAITLVNPATTPNAVQVAVAGSAANLVWAGGGTNAWNINGATTWLNGATPDKFFELDSVTFDATGAANPTVNLTTVVTPAAVTVNAANNYTFAGPGRITGNSGINKSGTGTLTLSNYAHDFAGALNVTGGRIVGNYLPNGGTASSFGAGTAITLDGGAIEVNGANQGTNRTITLGAGNGTIGVTDFLSQLNLAAVVGGTGGLIKDGVGALRIDAVATFTGNITVNAGVLRPNSTTALGSKTITVNAGGTFDPNGQTGAAGRPTINIIGTGVPGQAAAWNGGIAQTNNPLYGVVNLTGDASMGSNVRYDLNGGAGAPAGLSFNGGTFSLTKVGVGEMWWAPNAGATVANVNVDGGRFGVQSSSNLGASTGAIIVNPGGELSTFATITNDKPIRLNGGNFMNNNDATTATWTGGLTVSAPSYISGNANTNTRILQLTNPTFSLGGNTLTKVNRTVLNVSGATAGTGDGNLVVLGGTVTFNSGSLVNGGGVLAIKADGIVNIDDTGGASALSKTTQLDGGTLITLGGAHTIGNVNVTGHGVLRNGTPATTLTIPNLTVPPGSGITFSNTGDIALTNLNGAPLATGRLPAGFTAGGTAALLLLAQWDGTKIGTVPTNDANFAAPVPGSIELVNAATTLTADTTVDSLVADTTLNLNNSALLRLNGGTVILRGGANFQITTGTVATPGQLTSGFNNGELHLTEGIAFGTAGGDSGIRVRLVDNPGSAGAFRPMKLIKEGPGGLTDLGFDGTNGFDNTYTGGTLINNGRIPISSSLALGTGPVTVRDGGQVAFFQLDGCTRQLFAQQLQYRRHRRRRE